MKAEGRRQKAEGRRQNKDDFISTIRGHLVRYELRSNTPYNTRFYKRKAQATPTIIKHDSYSN
ncbi:hypothetical protein [Calothrix sp. UHCC 0171]|uniref:hypothetical protein n=1 Tax=Calothrix sp. UHCC 0171 TaxID=3110245 RepID=UPI002B21B2B6|nr:hypothetical protein [Calothrix sp. UHCC 0171]MEA5571445.1 hypothetical protein [Calothrix sp. UHCC 0171]